MSYSSHKTTTKADNSPFFRNCSICSAAVEGEESHCPACAIVLRGVGAKECKVCHKTKVNMMPWGACMDCHEVIERGFDEYASECDPVNSPSHYRQGKIEVIDFIEDQKLEFHAANVVKYVCRARHKGNELQDLEKAKYYLDRLVENTRRRDT